MSAANVNLYRTTQNIIIPKNTRVVFISHVRQEAYRLASALINLGPEIQYEWVMDFDTALAAGFIEKVE